MRVPWLSCVRSMVLALGWLAASPYVLRGAEDHPTVDEILQRFIEHSQTAPPSDVQAAYRCTRQTITEDMDSDGKIKHRKVKVGETQSHASGPGDARKWSSSNGFVLDDVLLRRYHFTLTGDETLNGRHAYVMTFAPRQPAAPIRHFQDHLLNRVNGTLWIDAEDYELVKANLTLGEPVSFGILGAVDALTFAFERARLDEGSWLTRWTETFVKARKFLTPLQTRKRVDWSDFRRVNISG